MSEFCWIPSHYISSTLAPSLHHYKLRMKIFEIHTKFFFQMSMNIHLKHIQFINEWHAFSNLCMRTLRECFSFRKNQNLKGDCMITRNHSIGPSFSRSKNDVMLLLQYKIEWLPLFFNSPRYQVPYYKLPSAKKFQLNNWF